MRDETSQSTQNQGEAALIEAAAPMVTVDSRLKKDRKLPVARKR